MNDVSNLRAPGWSRVVADLSAPAPDDTTFLVRLLSVLGQVSSARQAVLLAMDGPGAPAGAGSDGQPAVGEPRVTHVWPPANGGAPEGSEPAVEAAGDVRTAARTAAETGQVRVFGLDRGGEGFYEPGSSKGYVIAVPVPGSGAPGAEGAAGARAVITLLTEGRSRQALQTTVALVEVLAGYAYAHASRQQLKRMRAASGALDLASRMVASVNSTRRFRGAALQLVNDLARHLKADRVALGWVRGVDGGGSVRVEAVSDTEHIDRRTAMIRKIEAAMDECLDQEQPVLHPPPPESGEGADVLLAHAITHAHRELAASDAKLKVASLPLRAEVEVGGTTEMRVVGVVTIEVAGDGALDPAALEVVLAALDLVAPVLLLRRSDDRPLPARAWVSTVRAASWAVGARHTVWKVAGLALMAAAVAVVLVRVPYRVEAPMELRPRERRIVSVPFEGIIASLAPGVEAGVKVTAGQLLAEMDVAEMQLQALEAEGQLLQAQTQADAALKGGKLAEAKQAEAKAEGARARLELLRSRIERARIVSPIDGVILAGDLKDRIGGAVKLGEALFEIAPLEDMQVVAHVGDRDIAMIEDAMRGEMATKAYPARAFALEVERIVPLARAQDGRNAFDVYAKLDGTAPWMRPGMEGFAKFDVGERSLLWIGTRRIRDTLRLWLWW